MQDYIPIKRETLMRFANEARRLGGTESDLSTEQMIEIFSAEGGGTFRLDLLDLGFAPQEVGAAPQYQPIDAETYNTILRGASTGFMGLTCDVLRSENQFVCTVGLQCAAVFTQGEAAAQFFEGKCHLGGWEYTLTLETNNPAEPTEYAIGFSVVVDA